MNKLSDVDGNKSFSALKEQLEMNMLLQPPTNFANLFFGTNSFSQLISQTNLMQLSSLNSLTSTLMSPQNMLNTSNNWMSTMQSQFWGSPLLFSPVTNLNQSTGNFGQLGYGKLQNLGDSKTGFDYVSQLVPANVGNSTLPFKDWSAFRTPMKQDLTECGRKRNARSLDLEKYPLEDLKVDSTIRRESFSTDQCTQEIDTKIAPKKCKKQQEAPTSIVFNIRRYSKKHNKFILLTRHRKLITKCAHVDEEYYAKGMCKKCYHNKGERGKYATKCGHEDKYHYARGLCKGCYLFEYHKDRKTKLSE